LKRSEDGKEERFTAYYWNRPNPACTAEVRAWTCGIDYDGVVRHLRNVTTQSTRDLPSILFTDRQVEEKDQTFPLVGNYSMLEEMWMMVQSEIHYGNPMSSVDLVLHHWRQSMRWWQDSYKYGPPFWKQPVVSWMASHQHQTEEQEFAVAMSNVGMEPAECF